MGRAVGWGWGSGFLLGGDLGVRVGVWGGFGAERATVGMGGGVTGGGMGGDGGSEVLQGGMMGGGCGAEGSAGCVVGMRMERGDLGPGMQGEVGGLGLGDVGWGGLRARSENAGPGAAVRGFGAGGGAG